jgi:hypothetical protein
VERASIVAKVTVARGIDGLTAVANLPTTKKVNSKLKIEK